MQGKFMRIVLEIITNGLVHTHIHTHVCVHTNMMMIKIIINTYYYNGGIMMITLHTCTRTCTVLHDITIRTHAHLLS